MRIWEKVILMCLSALMLLGTVACAAGTGGETGSQLDTAGQTTAGVEEETVPTLALPELDYKDAEFYILCSDGSEDLVGDVEGTVVEAAVHERNLNVENRLHVKLEITEDTAPDVLNTISQLILANDDTFDLVAGYQYVAIPQTTQGLYRDMSDQPYLDWEKPWWADDYMKNIEFDDNRYVLIGDISLLMLKSMSAFFVNKRLYGDEFGPVEELYQTVFDGKWTWDRMATCASQVYRDVNGNTKTDDGDILGLRTYFESPTDHMAYSAGLAFSRRDENGRVVLLENQSRNIEIAEKIFKLMYENKGCFLSKDFASFEDHVLNSFGDGETLFCAYNMSAADHFRDMDDEYAIITYPKLDEQQESYHTLIHDIATVFAVPRTVKDERMEMTSAILEAMCYESYRTVTPAYYDVVLKSQYSKDPQSARAVDMIRANIRTDFIYANNYIFQDAPLGTIIRKMIQNGSNSYASLYRGYSARVEQKLNELYTAAEKGE